MLLKKPCLLLQTEREHNKKRLVYVTDLGKIIGGPDEDRIAYGHYDDIACRRMGFYCPSVICHEGTFEGIDVAWQSPSFTDIPSEYRYVDVIVGYSYNVGEAGRGIIA